MAYDSPPWAMDSTTQDAAMFRRAVGSLLSPAGGIVTPGDLTVTQQATPNMSVAVGTGQVWIPGTTLSTQGPYYSENHASINQAINAASATNPRIDTIYAQVIDQAYAGTGYLCQPGYVAGAVTAGLTVPPTTAAQAATDGAGVVPASSYVISYVLVPKNATSIVTADIANVATTVLAGGIGPWATLTLASGLQTAAGYSVARFRKEGDIVRLSGLVLNASAGNLSAGVVFSGLTPTCSPPADIELSTSTVLAGTVAAVELGMTAGTTQIAMNGSWLNGYYLNLEGLTYPLS